VTYRKKFSVIVPVLYEEKYIEELIKNLKALPPKLEIIIVSSSEDDKTVEIARRYLDKVYVINERGISRARNFGAKKAEGEILLFIDADVRLPKNTLDVLEKAFSEEGVVGATCKIMPSTPNLKERVFFIFYNMLLRLSSLFKPHARGEFLAVRKDAFLRIGGFNEELSCLEDHDLAMRISKIGHFKFIDELTVYESMRRFHKWGFLKVLDIWVKNYLSYIIRGRPVSATWQPVR